MIKGNDALEEVGNKQGKEQSKVATPSSWFLPTELSVDKIKRHYEL